MSKISTRPKPFILQYCFIWKRSTRPKRFILEYIFISKISTRPKPFILQYCFLSDRTTELTRFILLYRFYIYYIDQVYTFHTSIPFLYLLYRPGPHVSCFYTVFILSTISTRSTRFMLLYRFYIIYYIDQVYTFHTSLLFSV